MVAGLRSASIGAAAWALVALATAAGTLDLTLGLVVAGGFLVSNLRWLDTLARAHTAAVRRSVTP